jgi:hypothetical protein
MADGYPSVRQVSCEGVQKKKPRVVVALATPSSGWGRSNLTELMDGRTDTGPNQPVFALPLQERVPVDRRNGRQCNKPHL